MSRRDDITWNYHKGHPLSTDANDRTRKEHDRAELYRFVFAQGRDGATADEADQALGKGHQTTSARFSDLKRDGLLVDTGLRRRTRKHCAAAVFIADKILTAGQPPPAAPQRQPKRMGDSLPVLPGQLDLFKRPA